MELNLKRETILEDALVEIKSWDTTYEMGIAIVDSVEEKIEEIKQINSSIELISGSLPFDEVYRDKMAKVVDKYGDLLELLEVERVKLLELIKETRLKESIKNSYILQDRESIFIDKDL